MNKTALAITLILVLLLSIVAGKLLVGLAEANPYVPGGTRDNSLIIYATSPQNNTVYTTSDLAVVFNVSTPIRINVSGVERAINSKLLNIYYSADWLLNDTIVLKWELGNPLEDYRATVIEHSIDYQIPDGEHSLTIVAEGWCTSYVWEAKTWFSFDLTGSSRINFTIDTITPSILSLSVENKTYHTTNLPLTLTTNEPVFQISYSLDEQANVTVAGNATLTDLPNGSHEITFYAWDEAGNVGASEIVHFSVDVPFPTPLVIASVSIVAIVCLVMFVYLKKRKGEVKPS